MTNQEFIELIHSTRMELIWNRMAGLITTYFRTKVTGARHIHRQGPMIIAPNHSGPCGFDVVVLSHVISRESGRRAKILAHRAYFEMWQLLRMVSESFGLRKASIKNGTDVLAEGEPLLIFPEAEGGNFKSSLHMYELQPFHTGFVRMAMLSGAPIIPTLVVGAEESNFNLGSIDLSGFFSRLKLPIPVNVLPLPAKWHIKFLKPVSMRKYKPADADDKELVARIAGEIHDMMQVELLKMSHSRKTIYV
jgi:1-acyl-sn-glycerol-3-phosphate acyltransferase